jgi:formylglycine-generating enzyme required for sulfatase activity/serine/threonine protein kinase
MFVDVENEDTEKTEIVGRYALHGQLAHGGMAVVYLGKLLGPVGFSRPVAVKRLHPQLARDEHVRDMFIDEARLTSRICHPNVVPTLDVVTEGGELLLVMEYVHGETLQHLLRATRRREERMPLRIVLAIASALLHGLHAAHEATTETGEPLCIVHRDVSPQNVMVGVDGVARVLDFGIARAAVRLESTREGVVKGKIAYMAPEQLGGGPVDRRTDVYGAAVILWEMLAGRRLFVRDDGASVMVDKLLRGNIEPPSRHAPGVPKLLDAIVLNGLSRSPEQRFPTAREMALALEKVGEMARPSEVGAWVQHFAPESLAQRATRLRALDMTPVRVPDDGPTHVVPSAPPAAVARSLRMHLQQAPNRPLLAAVLSLVGGFVMFTVTSLVVGASGDKSGSPTTVSSSAVAAAAVAAPKPLSCPIGMVRVPGGKFFMGNDDGLPMERPSHNVALSPYCIDVTEVTTEDYKACSDNGECKRAGVVNDWDAITDADHKTFDPLCNVREPRMRAKHPINCVDWEMATIYCRSHGKRLPTEAEWEFAARGPDGRKYPWGDEEPGPTLINACGKECVDWSQKHGIDAKAMFTADDGWATTSPVGSFPRGASRYGLQDIVGNVWEWVGDWYAPYGKDDSADPSGADQGDARVIRGGAWNGSYAAWVRPTFRYKDAPTKRSYGIGFRCAAPFPTQ